MPEKVVFIVDDDRTIVRLCQRILERVGYRTLSAMDPLEALQVLKEQRVDLLLSDIYMPVMDGFELVTRAKQIQPDMPVLVMTGHGSIENALQALHRGVDGLIIKPFDQTADLVQAVRRVLEESSQKRDAARLQALQPLFDIPERLISETSPQPLEQLILSTILSLFQASCAGIFRVIGTEGRLEPVRSLKTGMDAYEANRLVELEIIQMLFAGGAPVVAGLNSGWKNGPSQLHQHLMQRMREFGMESVMVIPVQRENSHVVLSACRSLGSQVFTEADLEMFVILARQAAVAMENARLYSELKEYVHRVEDSQRALVQAEKMAAVGRLVASVAHEVNNPLQSVRNCLHLAARPGLSEEQRMHYLMLSDGELERLVNTVRRMLDFYRPGGMEVERILLRDLLNNVLELIGPQLRDQSIQVHVRITGSEVPVTIVPDQIQQVIFNLLINAMDAFEGASTEKQVWVDVEHHEQSISIRVEDDGPGIPDEMVDQVFEPFVSTKQHGTGLGLAVSYGIIERHQGTLSLVPARYGKGACFQITLPLKAEVSNGKNFNSR